MLCIHKTSGRWRYFDATPKAAARIKAITSRARETFEAGITELPYNDFHLRSFKVPSMTREGLFHDVIFYPDNPFCNCEGFKFRKECRHIEAVKLFVPLQTIAIPHAGIYTWSNDKKQVSYHTAPDGRARRFEARDIISNDRWTLIVPAFYLNRYPMLKEVA